MRADGRDWWVVVKETEDVVEGGAKLRGQHLTLGSQCAILCVRENGHLQYGETFP